MDGEEVQSAQERKPKGVASLVSRTVKMSGEMVTLKLEPSYWEALDEIAGREELTPDELCTDIRDRMQQQVRKSGKRGSAAVGVSLANAVRVFVVGYYRQAATERGHARAGHGHGDPFVSTPFDTATSER